MTLRPPLDALDHLVEPLTDGELRIARALSTLDPGWTVFVKPRIGLDRPDFIAMHDTHGVCVIDVVAWNPDTTRRTDAGDVELLGAQGSWTLSPELRFSASRARSAIFDQFYALPQHGGTPTAAIRAAVIMPAFSTAQTQQMFAAPSSDDPQSLIGVYGADSIDTSIRDIVVGLGCPVPNPASMSKLKRHMVASERLTVPPETAAWMSPGVRDLALNPLGQRTRRVRGAAGSGKSFGVTARAAQLAADGKRVLILTMNVTLANRLRSMATDRCREVGANPTLISCSNFHSFCTRVVQDAEMGGLQLETPRGAPWTIGIVAKAEQALELGFDSHYDAILVDEGQDFTIEWWNLLRSRVLSPGGEMLAAADPTQDIYDRFEWTTDDTVAAGFTDGWTDLDTSYRLPSDLLELTNELAAQHLEGEHLPGRRPSADDGGGAFDNTTSVRNWINIDRLNTLGRAVGHEVVRLLKESPTLRPGDIAFVCDYHHDGVAAVRVIENAGYPVHHIFSRDPDAPRRRRKHRFWPDADAVKGCTAHSLKGWETPALVMGIGVDDRAQRLAYVAMTRVAIRPEGGPSFVSVVSAERRLDDFGRSFVTGSAPVPTHAPATAAISSVPPPPLVAVAMASPSEVVSPPTPAQLIPTPSPTLSVTEESPTPSIPAPPAVAPGGVSSTPERVPAVVFTDVPQAAAAPTPMPPPPPPAPMSVAAAATTSDPAVSIH